MRLFDLHCDTLYECWRTGERLEANRLHIDLDRGRRFDAWAQVFAVWMPDTIRGEGAWLQCRSILELAHSKAAALSDRMELARSGEEIDRALSAGRCAAILAVEGGSALAGSLEHIRNLAERGVRILTLTWNGENELGSGADMPGGLTPRGVKAVEACEDAGIIIDVSHLNDRGFGQMADLARRPFVASHSNARAVCNHRRNLTDEQFMRIVAAKGLVGLNFCTHFLSEEIADPPFSCLAAHIEHFLSLGGEQTLALGSDYDGTDVPSWLDPARKVEDLYQLVCGAFGQALANRLFFENALDFMKRYELAGEG